MGAVKIFNRSKGLNTKDDPARIDDNELSIAVNVDVSPEGRISRRKGYSSIFDSGCHSLFSAGDYMLAVVSGKLSMVEKDGTISVVTDVVDSHTIRYQMVGPVVYGISPSIKFIIKDKIFYPWVVGENNGVTTDRQFYAPPYGQLIAHHSSRLYIADGSVAYFSEPFRYDLFELFPGHIPFGRRLSLMAPVADGMWYADNRDAYFISGMDPAKDIVMRKFSGAGAAEGTGILIPGEKVGSGRMAGSNVVAWCGKSICIGGPGGYFKNISGEKLELPNANTGSGYYHDGRLMFCLHSY